MNKISLLITGFLLVASVRAQKSEILLNPDIVPVTFHGETSMRLDEYDPAKDSLAQYNITKTEKLGYHPKGDWFLNPTVNPNALPQGMDPALQTDYSPATPNRAMTQNFDGMGYTGVNPADPSVDVGPNHVVQMINGGSGSYIEIFDKTGGSLFGPTYFDNYMSTMTGAPAVNGAGDPIVMYDERADRWVLTEFAPPGADLLYVAVSTSPDPLGTYYVYSYAAPNFPDYPKYSIWTNSYVITTNEAGNSPVYALDRTSLLGGAASVAQRFTIPAFGTIGFQAATPVSLNGTTAPPAGTPAYVMRMRDDAWAGSATDALELWEFDIDWVTPANTSITLPGANVLGIAPYESELCGYTSFACIPQPGTGVTLDPLREVLMNRIHYRNFGSHESIVCCHVADVDGSDHAGIRWYELRRVGGTGGNWTIHQEGTYAPDADDRWMPSIGISASGNIGLAYNVSSGTTFPSLRYTGRRECDPLNVMTEGETTIVAGSGSNASNRYGDYNAMGLDPSDGETFWFTGKYNASAQWSTRIAAFDIPTCSPQVSFAASTFTVNEPDANVANGCLPYYVLNVPISIGSDPSQPADVTVNVAGGTATQGVDYDIFNSSFTFSGATLTGNVEIWVYNDDYVEGVETIDLDYTLNANGGNATNGTINQTVTVTINDDDLAPAAMIATTTVLSHDFESGLAPFTTNNPSGDTPFQVDNEAGAESAAYNIPSDNTTQFAYVNDDVCDCDQNNVYLTAPTMDLSAYTSAVLTFDSYFEDNTWAGDNEDADVEVSIGGGPFTVIGPLVASGIDVSWTQQTFNLTPYVGNNDVVIRIRYSDATGWLYGCSIDNWLVTAGGPIAIQTIVNTGSGDDAYLGPNSTVHFYDPATSDVMMSITNTSAWDYGCVTVEVDREGQTPTAEQFNSVNVPDYIHEKTYRVIPTNNNPTGTFDVTVYYEEAEVAAWEAATGNSRNNAEVIKVAGNNQISDVTPANYTGFTIDNIPATLGAFNSDVTFTASFTNGFSGFGVGIYNVPSVTVIVDSSSNPLCDGGTDGTIYLSASGGVPPYDYSIDNGSNWQSSGTFTGLSAGTYQVLAMDNNGTTSTMIVEVLNNPPALSESTSSTDETCGLSNGSITLSGSGGTPPYQYSINGGALQASGNFNGLTAGSYTYLVEDDNGCQVTGSITVGSIAGPSISSTTDVNPACNGDSNGSITVNATGGTAPLQYSINGGTLQSGNSFTGLADGTYTLLVEDANGCQTTTSVTLTEPSAVTYSSVETDENCGNADGTITLSGSGGTPGYQYSINGGALQASGNFTGLAAGSYTVLVEDANGCQASGSVTVNSAGGATITSTTDVNPACNGDSNGSIVVNATGGTAPLQYSINGGALQSGNSFTGLADGTYILLVEDANGCQTTTSVTLTEPSAVAYSSVETDENCGNTDGTITLTGSGGTPGYQYSINGGAFQASGNFTGLAAGSYTVLVEDANGCQATGSVTVGATTGPSISSTTDVDPLCNGDSNGTITVNASGGTAPLQYSINGGTLQSGNSFSGLSDGTYTILVEDVNGCQSTTSVSLTEPSAVTYSAVSTDAGCIVSNGTLTITGSGGVGPYMYSINGGTLQASGSFTGLAAGSYTVLVEDANGCQATGSESVNSTGGASISSTTDVDPLCNGSADGSITVNATGGTAPLQYSINGGALQSGNSFTGLSAGTYSILVEDAAGCQTTASVTLTDPLAVSYTANVVDASCGLNDGSITITGAGGTGPYMFSINGGTLQSSGSFTGLGAGAYTILVEDANGCQANGSETVNSSGGATITSTTDIDPSCNGGNDGSITVNATGGTAPLQFSINGGTLQGSNVFSGLSAGIYTLLVEDAGGCQSSVNVTLGEPTAVSYSASATDENCGAADGTLTITGSGGTAPYQYSINGGALQSSGSFTGLVSGSYSVLVEDANGCQTSATENVNSTGGATITSTNDINPSCNGSSDGSIEVLASGGNAPIQYSINGGALQSSNVFMGLSDGSYTVLIEDASGCQNSVVISLIEPAAITNSSTIVDATCGNSDGSIDVVASGGDGSFMYSINGGAMQTSGSFTGLASGTYTIVIEDGNGCQLIISEQVNSINGPSIDSTTVVDLTCNSSMDGSIDLFVSGGTAPILYSIDGGASSQSSSLFTGLSAGSYDVVITDDNGCQVNATILVNEPDLLSLTLSANSTTCGLYNGDIVANVNGGVQPYSYSWNDPASQTNLNADDLAAGTYSVEVADANGCVIEDSATVAASDSMFVDVDVVHESCTDKSDGSIVLMVDGGNGDITYLWSTGDTSNFIDGLTANIYTVSITDTNNCTVNETIEILTDNLDCIVIPTAISPNGDGSNDVWVIQGLDIHPDAVVEIYNRWGSILFSSNSYQNDWDGTYQDKNLPAGVYYFVVSISEDEVYTGSLTILR